MGIGALAGAAWAFYAIASLGTTSSFAGGLMWEVENPFRFFKDQKSFALHEAAFAMVRGDASAAASAHPVWRTERVLNDPDCRELRPLIAVPPLPAGVISKAALVGRRRPSATLVMTETDGHGGIRDVARWAQAR